MNPRLEIFSPKKWAFYANYAYSNPDKALARARFKIRKLIDPEHPNWALGAVKFLEANLSSDHSVGEYGSGLSSIWLARRAKRVCSIEHDKTWFNNLVALQKKEKISNLTLCLTPNEQEQYINAMGSNFHEPLDLLIIDGIFREACAHKAKTLVRKGGFILLDDSQRKEYVTFIPILGKRIERFDDGVRCTDIFISE